MAAILWLPAWPVGAAITLAEFSATAQLDGSIVVRWVTATELNSSQFILYRSEQPDGPWDYEVNRQDAKDLDGIIGATYVYTDANVILNTKYYYVLGELEKNGNLVRYTDARTEATAGQVSAATATATPTQIATPTLTATPIRTPTATTAADSTVTNTATPTATNTPSRTPSRAAQEQPTATREYTNTPRPDATGTPAGTPAATPPVIRNRHASAVSRLVKLPHPQAVRRSRRRRQQVRAQRPFAPAPTAGMSPSPSPQVEMTSAPTETVQPTSQVTQPPRIFESVATTLPMAGTPQRPSAQTAVPPADEAERNTRLVLLPGRWRHRPGGASRRSGRADLALAVAVAHEEPSWFAGRSPRLAAGGPVPAGRRGASLVGPGVDPGGLPINRRGARAGCAGSGG